MTATMQAPKEHPILFSGPMVRAILEGCKTQTRRVVKSQPRFDRGGITSAGWAQDEHGRWCFPSVAPEVRHICPYGESGDTLWVRETWAVTGWHSRSFSPPDTPGHHNEPGAFVAYQASGDSSNSRREIPGDVSYKFAKSIMDSGARFRWRPSIHMTRWASRITLEVTGVRVQRLQDISAADAIAEGASQWEFGPEQCLTSGERGADSPYRSGFACLWDSINADRGFTWKSNPWVWAITFKRLA